jgi:hypothetical protein
VLENGKPTGVLRSRGALGVRKPVSAQSGLHVVVKRHAIDEADQRRWRTDTETRVQCLRCLNLALFCSTRACSRCPSHIPPCTSADFHNADARSATPDPENVTIC